MAMTEVTRILNHGSEVNIGSSPVVQYAYADGSQNTIRPTSMTYPNGIQVLNYDYGISGNDDDQLSRIQKLKLGTAEIASYQYLGLNQVAVQRSTQPLPNLEYTLATGSGDNLYQALDRFGRIVNLRWQQGGTPQIDNDYTYDRASNRLTQNVTTHPTVRYDERYQYDGLHRLVQYQRGSLDPQDGTIGWTSLEQDFGLDETGNFKTYRQEYSEPVNQARNHNSVNEILGYFTIQGTPWAVPVYDPAGNMASMPQPNALGASYTGTWDAWNRLVRLSDGSDTVAEYQYDGLSRRIVKKSFTDGRLVETRHSYLSSENQVLEERVGVSNTAERQFVWGIRFVDDLLLRDRDTGSDGNLNERLYALSDLRFSVLALVDPSGSVVERFAYAAYGRSEALSPDYTTRPESEFQWEYRYTGRELDLETGLIFFRARFFHAELGVFISRDPIGYIDGMNLYRAYFVPSDVDPLGGSVITGIANCRCCRGGVAFAVYGAVKLSPTCSIPAMGTAINRACNNCCGPFSGWGTNSILLFKCFEAGVAVEGIREGCFVISFF